MKLVSLNVWGLTQREALVAFLKEHEPTTDIFCFQEVSRTASHDHAHMDTTFGDDAFDVLQNLLTEFEGYYASTHHKFNWRPVEFDLSFGNALFVRKNIKVLEDGHTFVHRNHGEIHMPELLARNWFTLPRLVQYVQVETPGGGVTICNFHGLWHESGKGDIPERQEQSEKIRALLEKFEGKKILCGDFNMEINSESLRTLEKNMRNLIKEFAIKTTRNKFYPKKDSMPFADYTLVSPEVEVADFKVPDVAVSDHLPMILEFK